MKRAMAIYTNIYIYLYHVERDENLIIIFRQESPLSRLGQCNRVDYCIKLLTQYSPKYILYLKYLLPSCYWALSCGLFGFMVGRMCIPCLTLDLLIRPVACEILADIRTAVFEWLDIFSMPPWTSWAQLPLCTETPSCKPRRESLLEIESNRTLILDFYPPKLWRNPSVRDFVMATQE